MIFFFKRKILTQIIMKQVLFMDKKYLDFIFKGMLWLTFGSFLTHLTIDIYTLCLALNYGTVLFVSPFVTKFLWISGTLVNIIYHYFIHREIYAFYGFWLASATRYVCRLNSMIDSMQIILNIDDLTHPRVKQETKNKCLQRICHRMRRKRINRMIDCFIKDYAFICEMTAHFNSISKNMLFIMTLVIALINALLLHVSSIIREDPLIAFTMFVFWVNYTSGSIFILKIAGSVAKKSETMYRLLNSMYVRKGDALTLNQRKEMSFMIENLGSKQRSPLSLINLDGQVYDNILLGRYLVYSLRMIVFCVKFSDTLGNH